MIEQKIISLIKNTDFKCQKCSYCCRIEPGAIFITREDSQNIADHLNITKEVFFKEYCRNIIIGSKKIVSIKEKPNYDCLFWENGCKIYQVRPVQCRTYPFWPSIFESQSALNLEAGRCRGINKKGNLTLKDKIKLYTLEKEAVHFEYEI